MKDWVKTFLTSKLYREAKGRWGKSLPTDSKREVVTIEFGKLTATETGIYYALIECLQCYFGEGADANVAANFSQPVKKISTEQHARRMSGTSVFWHEASNFARGKDLLHRFITALMPAT